jgi:hypothetical protein
MMLVLNSAFMYLLKEDQYTGYGCSVDELIQHMGKVMAPCLSTSGSQRTWGQLCCQYLLLL